MTRAVSHAQSIPIVKAGFIALDLSGMNVAPVAA